MDVAYECYVFLEGGSKFDAMFIKFMVENAPDHVWVAVLEQVQPILLDLPLEALGLVGDSAGYARRIGATTIGQLLERGSVEALTEYATYSMGVDATLLRLTRFGLVLKEVS